MAEPTKIVWDDLYNLAARIDEVAAKKLPPGFEKLAEDASTPFGQPTVFYLGFFYKFELEADPETTYPSITNHYAESLTAEFPDDLTNLRDSGDLYFVLDSGNCLCKTIFGTVSGTGDFSLYQPSKDDPSVGCCNTLLVPQSILDDNQQIIPAALAAYYNQGIYGKPEDGEDFLIRDHKACMDDEGTAIRFRLEQTRKGENGLGDQKFYPVSASRWMDGSLTWPIRKKWMDKIVIAMSRILECQGGCGMKADSEMLKNGLTGDEGAIKNFCNAVFEDLQWSAKENDWVEKVDGCLREAGNLPWHQGTCTGVSTPENSCKDQLFFKNTLDQLNALVTKIDEDLVQDFPDSQDIEDCENCKTKDITGTLRFGGWYGNSGPKFKLYVNDAYVQDIQCTYPSPWPGGCQYNNQGYQGCYDCYAGGLCNCGLELCGECGCYEGSEQTDVAPSIVSYLSYCAYQDPVDPVDISNLKPYVVPSEEERPGITQEMFLATHDQVADALTGGYHYADSCSHAYKLVPKNGSCCQMKIALELMSTGGCYPLSHVSWTTSEGAYDSSPDVPLSTQKSCFQGFQPANENDCSSCSSMERTISNSVWPYTDANGTVWSYIAMFDIMPPLTESAP